MKGFPDWADILKEADRLKEIKEKETEQIRIERFSELCEQARIADQELDRRTKKYVTDSNEF